jgi:sugar O-acyltransferase (sialic acid O-acetyltransferase NeuD family)
MSASPDLLLVGAGGLGRESAAAVRAVGRGARLAFVDDALAVDTEIDGVAVVGPVTTDTVAQFPGAQVVVCTASSADPERRRRLVTRLDLPTVAYGRIVHPRAVLDECVPGPGSIVLAGAVATTAVTIGAHAVVMPGVVLVHDTVVGDYSVVAGGVALGGGVRVGEAAYLGAASVVREGCHIGDGAVVGMGAVVVRDVPAGEVWVGNPARRLR